MQNLLDNFLIKHCEEDIQKYTELLKDRKFNLRHLKFQAIMGKKYDQDYREFFTDLYNYSGLADQIPFDGWLLQPKWWDEYAEVESANMAITNIIDFYEVELNREGGNQYGW